MKGATGKSLFPTPATPVRADDPMAFSRPSSVNPTTNGRNRRFNLRDGLALQTIKVEYLEDFVAEYVLPPGLIIYLQLEVGDGLAVSVGGRPLPVGRHRTEDAWPFGFAMWRQQSTPVRREASRGTRLRVVTVWLTPEWFDQTFALHLEALPAAAREHLAISRWFPSRRLVVQAESLFDREEHGGTASRLRLEIFSLEMVSEALATVMPPAAREGRRTEMLLLNKARDLIETKLAADQPVSTIAADVGVGIATLRRLFKDAYGCTISEYIRLRRLDAARAILEEGGAVSAAASSAGYTSQANFSTAFKRRFGITPSRARAGEL